MQTCRHEFLDRTLIWSQAHLLYALGEFESFHDQYRPPNRSPNPSDSTAQHSAAPLRLLPRFGQDEREGIETACAELTGRALAAVPVTERARILTGRVTIDLVAKGIEVFSTRKEQVVRSYKGEIAGRVHAAHWAQAGTVLVADLLDGRSVRLERPVVSLIPLCAQPVEDVVSTSAGPTGSLRWAIKWRWRLRQRHWRSVGHYSSYGIMPY